VHHTMIIENTSLMQQDKYIFHLYVFSTCFGRDTTHHQELQNCTHSENTYKWNIYLSCCIKLVFSTNKLCFRYLSVLAAPYSLRRVQRRQSVQIQSYLNIIFPSLPNKLIHTVLFFRFTLILSYRLYLGPAVCLLLSVVPTKIL